MGNDVRARVVAVPVCRPARPAKGASIVRWRRRGVETQCLYMEAFPLRMGVYLSRMAAHHFRMETPLRGRSGGHTGTAPTIPLEQTSKDKIGHLLILSKLQKIKLDACSP